MMITKEYRYNPSKDKFECREKKQTEKKVCFDKPIEC